MSVLCYIRPWNERYFRYVCDRVFGTGITCYISDFKGLGSPEIARRFYAFHNAPKSRPWPAFLTSAIRDDIVARCRLLRVLPRAETDRFLAAMTWALDGVIEEVNPRVVVSITVDSYVLDLLKVCAERRGIPFLGLVTLFINGYCLVSGRGEYLPFRQPSEAECESVLDLLLSEEYRPVYLENYASSSALLLKRWLREKIKKVYFSLLPTLRGDPLNYHYRVSHAAARERSRLSCLHPGRFYETDWQERLQEMKDDWAYLPMQYHPECNTDYWSRPNDFRDYESSTLQVVQSLSRRVPIVAKEHPNMLGFRPPSFYKALRSMKNVLLVPPAVPSISLIECCSAVLIWSGSAGIEAAIRGKTVVTFGGPYYAIGPMYVNVRSRQELAGLPEVLRERAQRPQSTRMERLALVRHILSASLRGSLQECYFSPNDLVKRENADLVIDSLREHVDTWVIQAKRRLLASWEVGWEGSSPPVRVGVSEP